MCDKQSEVSLVQNPALGALTIWSFVLGYCKKDIRVAAPFNLVFLVLPLVANSTFRSAINSTRSSLFKMKTKMLKDGHGSSFLLLRETAPLLYGLSSESIGVAVSANLIKYDDPNCGFVPLRKTIPVSLSLSDKEQEYIKASKTLGRWMSQMSLWEICSTLGVVI